MALSTELLKRLNTSEEPIAKRLKLARNVFHASNLPLVRREDLILNWLCKISPDDPAVWSALECCLKQEQLDIKDQVKKSLIDIVVRTLSDEASEEAKENLLLCGEDPLFEPNEKLLQYCRLLVSNPTMQQYFAREPKSLARLVQSLLTSTYEFFKHTFSTGEQTEFPEGYDVTLITKTGGIVLSAYLTLVNVIEAVLQTYKMSYSTKEELRCQFIDSILYPLCRIVDQKCLDSTNRLGATAHKCIQQLIFGKRHAQSKSSEKSDEVFQGLLSKLRENVERTDSNVVVFVSLFRAAIGVYKDDSAKLDVIFRGLIDAAGTLNKNVMNACLKCTQDVTFDFEHKINEVTLFTYCQDHVDRILSQEKLTHADMKLIAQLTSFNPLITEKKVPEILRKIVLRKRTQEWTELMLVMLEASVRLRKEEKLVSQILIALRSSLSESSGAKLKKFYPDEFVEQFVKTASSITSSQTIVVLRTLIYHLSTDCIELLESKDLSEKISIMKATVELLTAFFDGISIFEYKGTLQWHEKFVTSMNELGSVLATSVSKALQLNYNKTVIELLLSATESWNKVQNALHYYVPKVIAEKPSFPISEDHWQQLVQRVANFGSEHSKNIMNRLILHKAQVLETAIAQGSLKLNSLIGGTEHFWSPLLQYNAEALSYLKTTELSRIASLLIHEMLQSKENFNYWLNILKNDRIQENRTLVLLLLCNALINLGNILPEGPTKVMMGHVKIAHIIAAELTGSDKIREDLEAVSEEHRKEEFHSYKLSKEIVRKIKLTLDLLSNLPLAFLTGKVRALAFVLILSVEDEPFRDHKIREKCHAVLSDLVDRPGIDVCRYLRQDVVLYEVERHKHFQKALEHSLRIQISEKDFNAYLEGCEGFTSSLSCLLESLEKTKSRTNGEQRELIKKFQQECCSRILDEIQEVDPRNTGALNAVTSVAKIASSNGTVSEKLKWAAQHFIEDIFMGYIPEWSTSILEAGAELAVILLRNRKIFRVSEAAIDGIWCAMLKQPNNDLLLTLIESTAQQDFPRHLGCLHASMVDSLTADKYKKLENVSTIWKAILKTDMSPDRNRQRLAAISKLLESVQSLSISEKAWPTILQLVCNILSAKHLPLSGSIVDVSIELGLRAIDEVQIAACDDVLTLCSILVKTRPSLIIDRLPVLLLLYKRIITTVTNRSKAQVDASMEHSLRCLAINIEKFTTALVKMKKDLLRLTPYLVADLLQLFADASIAVYVKGSLQNCISQLIGQCDQHGIALLSRTLPASLQVIFKTQLDTFNKFYKFSGKI